MLQASRYWSTSRYLSTNTLNAAIILCYTSVIKEGVNYLEFVVFDEQGMYGLLSVLQIALHTEALQPQDE